VLREMLVDPVRMGSEEGGFQDPHGCYFRNEAPSYEDRLILIAYSEKQRLLFVVHAEVGRDSIRIVGARKASPAQRKLYEVG
jgi:uncharacterized DUF497 family protein